MEKAVRAIRIGIPALTLAAFCLWLRGRDAILSPGTVPALVSAGLFALALTAALTRLIEGDDGDSAPFIRADTRRERLTAWRVLLLFGVGVSVFQYAAVYLLARPRMGFLSSFSELYYRSDVAHYMGIARDWYVREGDERLRLVFLPLYALAARLFTVSGNYFRGALFAAQVFSLGCLPAAYELFRLDLDREEAMAAARLLFLLPGAAFLRVPMSEGLFLLLTLLAAYFARRRRFPMAGLFTALAAFTRSLGVLLLGLLLLEMLSAFRDAYRKNKRDACRLLPGYFLSLLLGCGGTAAYLIINWQVSGSPFTFLTYQRENWTQELGLFFNTAAYQVEYGLMYLKSGDMETVLSLTVPNLICCFGVLGLLCSDRRRMRTSYLLWALVYFALSVGATWLLSGPRYLAMVFPLALTLQRLSRKPMADLALEGTLFLLETGYLLMLAMDLSVY